MLDTKSISNFDFQLNQIARSFDIAFISLNEILCNENGCMLYFDELNSVTSLDSGHLSGPASNFVVEQFSESLFLE